MILSICDFNLIFIIICSYFKLSLCRPLLQDSKTDPEMMFLGSRSERTMENISLVAEHKLLKKKMSELELNDLYDKCDYLYKMVEISNRYVTLAILNKSW